MGEYIEIVSPDVDAVIAMYQAAFGISFGDPDADLGQARVGKRADGTWIGVRRPMASHEQAIVRTYFGVDEIEKAVKAAEAAGGVIAYGPAQQGKAGTFAIVLHGGVQHGLWQR